ncbi:hypothetical protein IZU99_06245 [Oscillospiraceae bacterium CM]|nr:hypothetical protein IZU99_06245 [Oscillospiraceae bacterium CM]
MRSYEAYKSLYCGLCHALSKQYGFLARFMLTYDFTMLAMLLWDNDSAMQVCARRCPASPFVKKKACTPSPVLDDCAGYSVILAYWKLRDTAQDETFFKALPDRLLSVVYRGAYKKAAKKYPAFEQHVRTALERLNALENNASATLDACADCFALLTVGLAPGENKPLEQLLYHVGRFVYIIDACDDLQKDLKTGSFNPVARRFSLADGQVSDDDRKILESTLLHSCALAAAAFELREPGPWTPVVQNILYLGMPGMCARVLRDINNETKSKGMGRQHE